MTIVHFQEWARCQKWWGMPKLSFSVTPWPYYYFLFSMHNNKKIKFKTNTKIKIVIKSWQKKLDLGSTHRSGKQEMHVLIPALPLSLWGVTSGMWQCVSMCTAFSRKIMNVFPALWIVVRMIWNHYYRYFCVWGGLKALCNPKKMIFYCLTSAIMSKISY